MAGDSRLCASFLLLVFLFNNGQSQYRQIDLRAAKCDMSSRYVNPTSPGFSSLDCRGAINGNTGTLWTAGVNCISTTKNDLAPYWQVDLGQNYSIHRIIVFPELQWREYMVNTRVLVDDVPVAQFASDQSQLQNPLYITSVTRGRVIKLTQSANNYVTVCEVQVEVPCDPGTYGQDCLQTCSAGCQSGTCDVTNGACSCKAGWTGTRCEALCLAGTYGQNCQYKCSNGCQNTCNDVTGTCSPCNTGYSGTQCEGCSSGYYKQEDSCVQCGGGCRDNCNIVTGACNCRPGYQPTQCQARCQAGKYGQDCLQTCSVGCQGTCDNVNGTCSPCNTGYTGTQCEVCSSGYYKQGDNCVPCGAGCQGGTCDVTGHCTCQPGWQPTQCHSCMEGWSGADCGQTCSVGCNSMCDVHTGTCTCKAGWRGPTCEECMAGYYNNSGSCAPCGSGCSDTCLTQSGHCTCKPGWTPPLCQQPCESGKFGQHCQQTCAPGCDGACDVITGNCSCGPQWKPPGCTECSAGHYWPSSGCRACGAGCDRVTSCDPVNGFCTCSTGWEPPTCRACKTKLWGVNCSVTCGNCGGDGSCDLISGSCNFGLSSFEGESNTGAIVGSVVGVGVFIGVAILVVGVLLIRSRRLRRSAQAKEQNGDNCRNDAKTTDTALDVPNNMRTLKDTSQGELPDNGADNYDKLDHYENSDDIKPYASLQARNSDTTATGTNVYEIPENYYESNKRN